MSRTKVWLAGALFVFSVVGLLFLAHVSSGRAMAIGKVIKISEVTIPVTGEKLTAFALLHEVTGGNVLFAINGHNTGIKLDDRLRVAYSQKDLAAYRTDANGNRWNYWRVKTWEKLPPEHP